MENGGVVNHIGTFQAAILAQAFKIPFYVAAESYKFARRFPLNQSDYEQTRVPLAPCWSDTSESLSAAPETTSATCDYTPPSYITLLFTDLGILTPSAVSDELIKLYS